MKIKRNSLLQEGIRRLRNISPEIDILEKNLILSRFMNSLRLSGYNHRFWFHLLDGILKMNNKIENAITNGTRIRFRSRQQIVDMKNQKLGKFAATWFLQGTNQNTLKVQGTPDSLLVNKIQNVLAARICAEGGSTKVVELGGKKITAGLSNPVRFTDNNGCPFYPKCNIDPELDCRMPRSVY